jgi:SAM-dependent methyltransferase
MKRQIRLCPAQRRMIGHAQRGAIKPGEILVTNTIAQDSVFLAGEGDAWYRRNADALSGRGTDAMLSVLQHLDRLGEIESVCDLGCADGWRLSILRSMLPKARRFAGIEPGAEAIAAGRARWPDFELAVGTLADNPLQGSFDLVCVNGVLSWVDRAALTASLLGIDRLVAPRGVLIIADFAADAPVRVPYHHRTDVSLFTHKQNYGECFEAMGTYRETFRLERAYDDFTPGLVVPTRMIDNQNRWGVTVLVKA